MLGCDRDSGFHQPYFDLNPMQQACDLSIFLCPYIYISVCLSVSPSVFLICLSVYLSICLNVCLHIYNYICSVYSCAYITELSTFVAFSRFFHNQNTLTCSFSRPRKRISKSWEAFSRNLSVILDCKLGV